MVCSRLVSRLGGEVKYFWKIFSSNFSFQVSFNFLLNEGNVLRNCFMVIHNFRFVDETGYLFWSVLKRSVWKYQKLISDLAVAIVTNSDFSAGRVPQILP